MHIPFDPQHFLRARVRVLIATRVHGARFANATASKKLALLISVSFFDVLSNAQLCGMR